MALLASASGLRAVCLPESTPEAALDQLGDDLRQSELSAAPFGDLIERFRAYISGERVDFPDRLDLSGGTGFQRKVWETARAIPHGQTRSYGWLAEEVGRPSGPRAVGQALGRNPVPIIVPCHRVVGRRGALTGFRGGLAMKKRLLELEGVISTGLTKDPARDKIERYLPAEMADDAS
ncbi:MAG: methylated-DNA--[protein]-cysteine S-methyltransferase [Chloroflexi bacterium]|nr:methylated-DNA--[protein]-cysteine S-methyltransferase [Chloroflexota bacterium]